MAEKLVDPQRNSHKNKSGCNIVAIIPAYNEDRFIGSIVLKAFDYVHEVIVVDDGSKDQTGAVAEAAGARVVRHEKNMGKGIALNTGLEAARELSPDAVVILDADGQHDPAQIPTLAKRVLDCANCIDTCPWCQEHNRTDGKNDLQKATDAIQLADIVIGSRYLENKSKVPLHRILGHRVFNWITSFTSGIAATDSQSGFRAFSPKALDVLSFSSEGFSVESEMHLIAREYDLKIAETPITVDYQDKPKRNVIQHGLYVLNGILRLTGQYRPLLFFGLPGFFILLVGFGWGWWVVDIYRRTSELAVGYAMISVLLSITGLVLLSTGIILHSVRGLLIGMLRSDKNGEK
jgi:glycosyltransferase involved in cell wall biosynthesis